MYSPHFTYETFPQVPVVGFLPEGKKATPTMISRAITLNYSFKRDRKMSSILKITIQYTSLPNTDIFGGHMTR